MKIKSTRRFLAVMLAFAMVLTGAAASMISNQQADAAKKSQKVTLKLSKSTLSLTTGKTKTLKVTKKNVKKVKSTKWTSNKKSVATVSKKGKITAKKVGKATISCKVKYTVKGSKKVKTKTLKCKVTVKGKDSTPVNTSAPTTTPNPTGTVTPEPAWGVSDLTDPMTGKTDAATVTDEEVTEDKTNIGESHDSTGDVTTVDNGMMRKKMTAHQIVDFMGQGWNLANTMESCGIEGGKTVRDFETGWGAVQTTQKIIDGIRDSGFKSIRIPVAWSNMMSTDGKYTINADYMKRVETIVNYCLKDELYVVLNIHYDAGWWGMFGSADKKIQIEAWKKYEAIWQQIATRFNEYSDRLIFESANEELGGAINTDNLGLNTAVNGVKGVLTTDQLFETTNAINQKFVEIVRKTGGNNAYRHLLLAGYNTNIDNTCNDKYKMPLDTVRANGKEKLHVSVHYYDPSVYCISEDPTKGDYTDTWGGELAVKAMHDRLDKMAKFTEQGYGVIIGEYGPQTMAKKGVIDFYREIMTYGPAHHMVPMVWNLSMYDRTDKVITYSDIADLLKEITGAQNIPVEEGADITGVPSLEVVDEDTLDKVAEWSGTWTRTNNKSSNVSGECVRGPEEVGFFETDSVSEGMEVKSNAWWWQMFVKYDWSKLTKPCIKITLKDDALSRNAGFQLGYGSEVEGNADPSFSKVDQFDSATYAGKTITLRPLKLAVKPWVCLTNQTEGASIVKVEIFDEKK